MWTTSAQRNVITKISKLFEASLNWPPAPARNSKTYVNYLRKQNVVNDVIYNVSGDKIGQKFLINRPLWKWLTKRAIFFSPSSLSQQGGYILQKWKAAPICQVISTGQHHNPHRHQVSIEFVSLSARVAPFKSQKQEWGERVLRIDSDQTHLEKNQCLGRRSCKIKVVTWKYQCSFLKDSMCCWCTCACVRSNSVTMSDDPASDPQVSWCQTESRVDASS